MCEEKERVKGREEWQGNKEYQGQEGPESEENIRLLCTLQVLNTLLRTCSVVHFLGALGAVVSLTGNASPPPGLLHSVPTAAQELGGPWQPGGPGELCRRSSAIQPLHNLLATIGQ